MAAEELLEAPPPEAGKDELHALLEQLNAGLGDVTPYKLAIARPEDLLPTPTNAHYMPKRTFDILTQNIKRDGNLSTLPLCWKRADGRFELLSGNHRVESAKRAGVKRILILYTDVALSEGQRISLQLSHNALVGNDNPAVLLELWNRLDALEWKVYSGLDDALLETMKPVQADRINEAALRLEELTLLFLPSEIERIPEMLKQLGNANRTRLAASYEDWDRFFECLLTFKESQGIQNSATAIRAMTDIVSEWLDAQAKQSAPDAADSSGGE